MTDHWGVDIVGRVLTYLPPSSAVSCSTVCRVWYGAFVEYLHALPHLDLRSRLMVTDSELQSLLQLCSCVRKLDMDCSLVTSKSAQFLSNSLAKNNTLDLTFTRMDYLDASFIRDLAQIGSRIESLTFINFASISIWDEEAIGILTSSLSNLKSFTFQYHIMHTGFAARILSRFLRNCSKTLERLSFCGLNRPDMESLLLCGAKLRAFHYERHNSVLPPIDDDLVTKICTNCPLLESLHLVNTTAERSTNQGLTTAALRAMVEAYGPSPPCLHGSLKSLRLESKNSDVMCSANNLELMMSFCGEATAPWSAVDATELSFSGFTKLADGFVNEIFRDPVTTNLPACGRSAWSALHTLGLGGTSIGDAALLSIALTLKDNLRNLDLKRCRRISERGLIYVAKNCKGIRRLNLGWAAGVVDSAVTAFAQSCPLLTSLVLNDSLITDEGLCDLALGLGTGLRELALQRCVHITDQGVQILLQKCNKMAFLSLSECAGLSEACFLTISGMKESLKSLQKLRFDDTLVPNAFLENAAPHLSSIRYLHFNRCKKMEVNSLSFLNPSNSPFLKCVEIDNGYPDSHIFFAFNRKFPRAVLSQGGAGVFTSATTDI